MKRLLEVREIAGVSTARAGRRVASLAVVLSLLVSCGRGGEQPPIDEKPAVAVSQSALESTLVVDATGDTYLRSGSPNQNQGGDTVLSLQQSGKHRSLLFFDPSAVAASIGDGTVISATLELDIVETGSNWGSGRPISIHRLRQASAEYQATWNCALDGNVNNQQADCSGSAAWDMNASEPSLQPWETTATATTVITSGQSGEVSLDVMADVEAILAEEWAGHGWLLKKVEEGQSGSIEFASREHGGGPRLVLEVDGAPDAGAPPVVVGSASLEATSDTHLRQGQANQNFGSEPLLRIQASGRNRALVGFSAGAIASAVEGGLVSATLDLPIATTYSNWGPDRVVAAHRMRRGWGEHAATWNCAVDADTSNGSPDCSGDDAWIMSGSIEEQPWLGAPSDSVMVSSGQTGALRFDVTHDVACVLAGHSSMHGWLLKKSLESQSGKIELASRESATPPTLELEWTDGAGVAVAAEDCVGVAPPGDCTPIDTVDTTCDGIDDDCDGVLDDDFAVACVGASVVDCVDGSEVVTPCEDGNACNGIAVCASGSCEPGTSPTIDDGNPCTADSCDPLLGVVHEPLPLGSSCADDDVCNGAELCDGSGTCEPGIPLNPDDENPCTIDSCDATLGVVNEPIVEGTSCADGDACNGDELCDAFGNCEPGTAIEVDDENPCTEDICEPSTGAVTHPPAMEGTECEIDICTPAVCNGEGTCEPSGAPLGDDDDPCTIETCDPETGLVQRTCDPVDRTIGSNIRDTTEWLYTGPDPLQTGVDPEDIHFQRAALVHGSTTERNGFPVSGVIVSIEGHAEFGETVTQTDGSYQMVVNGGGPVVLEFSKDGYLEAQREVVVPWSKTAEVSAVVMVQPDPIVTDVDLLDDTEDFQVAFGSEIADADGTRSATLLIPADTEATLFHANGSSEPITQLSVRATEFTVGAIGPDAMPAELPFTSGYTYAIEFNADEAVAAGAPSIEFSEPLPAYVTNFLEFPAGTVVPVGAYDKSLHRWVPHESGVVLDIISVGVGGAEIDVTGDGVVDTGSELDAFGITPEELVQLAALYEPGDSLWRFLVPHFTQPYDCNWPVGPPPDAGPPPSPKPPPPPPCTSTQEGSIIECDTMTFREGVPITGTPFSLNYSSERVLDRTDYFKLDIVLSESTVPDSLSRIDLRVEVAGRTFTEQFPPDPSQVQVFTWDGKDVYGRELQGQQPVTVTIGYVYEGVYETAGTFADYGSGIAVGGNEARGEIVIERTFETIVGTWDAREAGLGGWTLDVHHAYVPVTQQLYLGSGERRRGALEATVLNQLLTFTSGVNLKIAEAGPDGSLYYIRSNQVFRLDPDLNVALVAGTGTAGFLGDEGPATSARLSAPNGLALTEDGTLYIADRNNNRIRAVDTDGVIHTVAGNGSTAFAGDGGPATSAQINQPRDVEVGPDGTIYVADTGNRRIRRISPAGIIATVAGNGITPSEGNIANGVKATSAPILPHALAFASDGRMFIASDGTNGGGLSEVSPDGIIQRRIKFLAAEAIFEDGMDAAQAALWAMSSVDVDAEGTVYFEARFRYDPGNLSQSRPAIMALTRDNKVYRVAMGGGRNYFAAAPATLVGTPSGAEPSVVVGPRGVHVSFSRTVTRLERALPPLNLVNTHVASPNSNDVFTFDPAGRHIETRHALTNDVLLQFSYDSQGLLATVTDGDGNTTTIERDGAGLPVSITGPYGHETLLELDENGFLSEIQNPENETVLLSSSARGLLKTFTNPRGFTSTMSYDGSGRLTTQERPNMGTQSINLISAHSPLEVEFETAEGRLSRYMVDYVGQRLATKIVEAPDGTTTEAEFNFDLGVSSFTSADGTVTTTMTTPDPRFGMSRPLVSVTTVLPSALTQVVEIERTVELGVPLDPFSLEEEETVRTVNGKEWTTVYDAVARRREVESPEGRTTAVVEDGQGRIVSQEVTGILPIEFSYDADGRLESVVQGTRETAFSYFSSPGPQLGYLQHITDALLQTTSFTRDAVGRTLAETYHDSSVTAFTWDENGNLESVTPSGQPTHDQTYTSMDDLATYEPPVVSGVPGPETVNTYNLDRQILTETRPDGAVLTWNYDAAGRIDTLVLPTGTIDHDYDLGTGQLTTIDGPINVTLDLGYDGMLMTSRSWSGDVAGSVAWTYNNDFLPITETVTGDTTSSSASFAYDDDNLMTCASPTACTPPSTDALNVTYNAASLPATAAIGNLSETYTYNAFGELATHATAFSGSPIFSMTYDIAAAPRDNLGRITRRSEVVLGTSRDLDYSYDQRGRLIGVAEGATVLSQYDYDDNGNRLSKTTPGGTVSGTYDDQDRLLTYGDLEYSYGENGELETKTDTVADETTTYVYDARGSLLSVTLPDTTHIEYLVDGQARRVGKKVDGILVQGLLYKDQLRIVAELDGNGDVVSQFTYVGGSHSPDYMAQGGAVYRFVKDQVGSPRLVVNAFTGDIAQELEYDEFGVVTTDTNPGFQPFGFAGGLYDADTGLVRFGARDYDAEVGRWTSKDASRFAGGSANLHVYAKNDPINDIDQSGQRPRSAASCILETAETCLRACTENGICGLPSPACLLACSLGVAEVLCFEPDKSGTFEVCDLIRQRPVRADLVECQYTCRSGFQPKWIQTGPCESTYHRRVQNP